MGRYLIRRILHFIPVFIGATFLIFLLVFIMPGDPIRALAGERAMPESVQQALTEAYNLDEPWWTQYWLYMTGLLQGDFGVDFRGRPVSDLMAQRIPITARLALVAFGFELIIGLIAGIVAGVRKQKFFDSLVLFSTLAVISVPIFVLGFLAQLLIGVELGWFPIAGISEGWVSYILPGLVLGAISLAYVARLTRTSLVENMRADYVRTARAKGLPSRRVVGDPRPAQLADPGHHVPRRRPRRVDGWSDHHRGHLQPPRAWAGRCSTAVQPRRTTVVVGIVTLLVLVFIFANLIVDVLYAVLDPRIRYE